ncbi:MAG: hypothetical protein ACREOU_08185 [Candidatus Eiseniibacteriota bacterium]
MSRRGGAPAATVLALAFAFALALTSVLSFQATATPDRALSFSAPDSSDTSAVAELKREAVAISGLFSSPLVHGFLEAVNRLPQIETRTVHHDTARTRYYDAKAFAALPETARVRLVTRKLDDGFYYYTRYGTPLAYSRALEILSANGFGDARGKRVLDFGYGGIGQLRLLATLGADAVGVEVDPLLVALYSAPGDQGSIGSQGGKVTLVHGRWPAEESARRGVGGGYDVFVSKNTLKRGYIHPERPVDKRMLVDLGVSDSAYARALAELLKPGGLALIYNLSPARSKPDEPYRPWTDGRCPFPRELLEQAGFTVIAYDVDDSGPAREMGRALGGDRGRGAMDLTNDLFGTYTLVRRSR